MNFSPTILLTMNFKHFVNFGAKAKMNYAIMYHEFVQNHASFSVNYVCTGCAKKVQHEIKNK